MHGVDSCIGYKRISVCTVKVSTQRLHAEKFLNPFIVTVPDSTAFLFTLCSPSLFAPDQETMPIIKVSDKNLCLPWTLLLPGAYLRRDPDSISFPVSTPLSILKAQQFSTVS